MGFHQIHEREQVVVFVGEVNDRLEEFLAISGEIVPTYDPGTQGRWRDAQVMRSFRDAVSRRFSGILGYGEVNGHFAHEIALPFKRLSTLPYGDRHYKASDVYHTGSLAFRTERHSVS